MYYNFAKANAQYYAASNTENLTYQMQVSCHRDGSRWADFAGCIDLEFHLSARKNRIQSIWHGTCMITALMRAFSLLTETIATADEMEMPSQTQQCLREHRFHKVKH